MKLFYQYMAIFFNLPPTLNHLHSLQVENCDSNSRLVVDGDDNGKFRLERVKSSRCIKVSHYISENRLDFPATKGLRREILIKLLYQFMAIFVNLAPNSSHLHPLQVENCGSNPRLVVDEDDNGKLGLERDKV